MTWLWFLVFFFAFILQISLLPLFSFYGVVPDLILVLVVFWLFQLDRGKVDLIPGFWFTVLFWSLFLELFTTQTIFGLSSLSLLATLLLINWLIRIISQKNFYIKSGLILLASLAYGLIFFSLEKLFGQWLADWSVLGFYLLVSPLINLLVFAIIYGFKTIFYQKKRAGAY